MTMLCSVFLQPWAWINNPTLRFICASADAHIAGRNSIFCRNIVDSPWYRQHWGDDHEKLGWRTDVGIGDALPCDQADVVVCDISFSNAKLLKWWDNTIAGLKARKIVVTQRLAQGDPERPAARVGPHLPADAIRAWTHETNEPGLDRPTSCGLLWPEMYSESQVQRMEAAIGSLRAASVLQQRPVLESVT